MRFADPEPVLGMSWRRKVVPFVSRAQPLFTYVNPAGQTEYAFKKFGFAHNPIVPHTVTKQAMMTTRRLTLLLLLTVGLWPVCYRAGPRGAASVCRHASDDGSGGANRLRRDVDLKGNEIRELEKKGIF